ncbi:MAG: hypothetical protein RhofKO_39220 [Rhodothermales bacterium]
MSPTRRQHIDTLLDQLLDLPDTERAGAIEGLPEPAEVKDELRALLRAAGAADPYFAEHPPAFELLTDVEPMHAQRIGDYRVIRELGRGGMGAVFLAERADGAYQQQVAIKLVQSFSSEAFNRFRSERQILARLNHPHIAGLMDGGVTEAGTPYLVMEYIEGVPITQYCRERNASVHERLHLFAVVCEAVQYAHRNLVVHRDLKPSNILVTAEGTVKLLDFGIAKILDDDAAQTQPSQQRLTPEYASPEQLRGDMVGTTSDVYQLGVLLYELLTDQRPFRLDTHARAELRRRILEEAPTRPSTAVRQDAKDTSTVPLTTDRLSRTLRGDLDMIVLMALRKDPERRYASIDALQRDVERHQQGLPVEAQPDSLRYRLRKYAQRYRKGIGLAVGLSIALVVITVVYVVNLADAKREADRERQRAEATLAFWVNVLAAPTDNPDATITEVADQLVLRLQTDSTIAADVQATLWNTIGTTYHGLGQYGNAQTAFEQSLTLRREVLGEGARPAIITLRNLAAQYGELGAYEAAESLYIQVEQLAERYDVPDTALGLLWANRASLAMTRSQLHRADSFLTIGRMVWNDASLGSTYYSYLQMQALLRVKQRRFAEADSLMAIVERDGAPWMSARERLNATMQMAISEGEQGRYAEANARLAQAQQLADEILPPFHMLRQQIASTQGTNARRLGQAKIAVGHFEAATRIADGMPSFPDTERAILLNNKALALKDAEQRDEALSAFAEARVLNIELYGAQSLPVATNYNNTGTLYLDLAQPDEALTAFEACVDILRTVTGAESVYVAFTLRNLARALLALGRLDDAADAATQSLVLHRRHLPPNHIRIANPLVTLAEVHIAQQQWGEAREAAEAAHAIRTAALAEDHPDRQEVAVLLAQIAASTE